MTANRILVIKLGAIGDVILSFMALERIRKAHPEAELTVLTTPGFERLYRACPWVDRVETDGRPKGVGGYFKLAGRLRKAGYQRIYDLQTSDRSSALYWGLAPHAPEWSGIAPFASHRVRNPDRDHMHALEQQAEQLKVAGIWPDAPVAPGTAPAPDLRFMVEARGGFDPSDYGLTRPYALLIPGGSAHRPGKRWPIERYAELAERLVAAGYGVGVVRGPSEDALARAIPAARDMGRTELFDVAALCAHAAFAVGNDTGPTHICAALGTPTLALFSFVSDPALCAPRGNASVCLRKPALADLPTDEVVEALRKSPFGAPVR